MTSLPAPERVTSEITLFPDAAQPVLKRGSGSSDVFLKLGVFGRHKRRFQPFPAAADLWYGGRGPAHLTDVVRRRRPSD
jgi:hypothetical protein